MAATGDVERAGHWFTVALPPDEDATTVPDLVGHLVALGAQVHGCTDARMHGRTGARAHGRTGARVHGCTGARGRACQDQLDRGVRHRLPRAPHALRETESEIALASLARPIRRSAVLLGKWLGLVVFGGGFVVLAGLAQCLAGFPFPSEAPLTATYLAWAAVWVTMVWGLAAASFVRKDL